VEFLTGTASTSVIRDEALYAGVRVTMTARITTAQVKLRFDINFGDPVETVLAEKLTTAIELGPASARVRDYADIFVLTGTQSLRCGSVREVLLATAAFRETAIRLLSDAVQVLVVLRAAYRRGLGPDAERLPEHFGQEVMEAVIAFADPLITGADPDDVWNPQHRRWEAAKR
jgi:hypothetical protein